VSYPCDEGTLRRFRECLIGLPSLHTLEIVNTRLENKSSMGGYTREIFRRPDFPGIRKVTIPLIAHPLLSRFPNMEELACFGHTTSLGVKPLLASVRGPYKREKSGEIEPVLKSFTLITTRRDEPIAEGT